MKILFVILISIYGKKKLIIKVTFFYIDKIDSRFLERKKKQIVGNGEMVFEPS